MGVVYLASDFGYSDPYVGIMKSRIHLVHPKVQIIDLSHDLHKFDISFASWFLYYCYLNLESSIFLAIVVDPGVGTERKCIIVQIENSYFVLPDNGLISLILKEARIKKHKIHYFEIDINKLKKLYLKKIKKYHHLDYHVSSTFHGRDVFSPALGLISKNIKYLKQFTKKIEYITIKEDIIYPIIIDEKQNYYSGKFVYYDIFGNLFTNFYIKELNKNYKYSLKILENQHTILEISEISITFAQTKIGNFLFYVGSFGFIEVARNQESAYSYWNDWNKIKSFTVLLEIKNNL